MKAIIDPGHKYELLTLDGELTQILTFVKRQDKEHPERFPGNYTSYPGTTMQSVIRCLVERVLYLDNQIPHVNNTKIYKRLSEILWLLEQRAAERHGLPFDYNVSEALNRPMCKCCGHIACKTFDPLVVRGPSENQV